MSKKTRPSRFIATTVAIRMAELRTLSPNDYARKLCSKFASYFTGVSRYEISAWLGLDLNRTAGALSEPLRYAQLAMLVPKLANACFQLAELEELFRLMGDEPLHLEMHTAGMAAAEFKAGLNQALVEHKDEHSKDFPDLVDALITLRTALKPTLAGLRAAYAQIFSTTVTKGSQFLSPVYQRKLPSAIPPMGRTIKMAGMTGSLQGLYQRLGPHADDVWLQVKPLITGDIDLLRQHTSTLATSLKDSGLLFSKM